MDYDYCKNKDCPLYIGGAVHRTTNYGCSYKGVKKTIAELIDELSVTNIKVFMLVDKVKKNEHTKEDAKKLEELNMHRSKLMNALSTEFKQEGKIKV